VCLISPQGILNSNENVNYNLGSGDIVNNNRIHTHILSSGMPAGSVTEQVSSINLLVSAIAHCAIEENQCNSIL